MLKKIKQKFAELKNVCIFDPTNKQITIILKHKHYENFNYQQKRFKRRFNLISNRSRPCIINGFFRSNS